MIKTSPSASTLPITGPAVLREIEADLAGAANKDLLIYLHVPFCNSKCVFCDWVADIPVRDLVAVRTKGDAYSDAMCRQIAGYEPLLRQIGYLPKFIYWGGGTPSRLEAAQILRIAAAMHRAFDTVGIEQHTMETSPDTLSPDKLAAIRDAGVRRISMGVQSLIDAELRSCARSHSVQQVHDAFRMIERAGFEDVNLDLIAAFPGQTIETLAQSVAGTIALDPTHVSVYVYRADPRTVMARQSQDGDREVVELRKLRAFYNRARDLLVAAGYDEYAIGYFAKEPRWEFKAEAYYFEMHGDYIGFGSGAHSLLGHRMLRTAGDLQSYLDDPLAFASCERFSIERPEALITAISQAIMTDGGINFARFERCTGFPFARIRSRPFVQELLRYFAACGAEFRDTADGLSVTPETRSDAHIAHLSGFYEAAMFRLQQRRAPAS